MAKGPQPSSPVPTRVTLQPPSSFINGKHHLGVNKKAANPDFSILQFYPEDARSKIALSARFGDGTVTTTGGGAGFVAVPRPQKKPITVWRGPQDAYTHEIPLIFDTLSGSGDSIESVIGDLEQVAGVDMFTNERPPLLILNAGGALPHDVLHSPQLRWVIPEVPVWGEAIRKRDTGERVRQLVTVKFMVFNQADELTRSKPKQVNSKTTYIAKKGDTYRKIAAKELKHDGGARWANRLARLNGARDGASSPKVGQTVKIPTPAEVKTWSQKPRR